VPRASAEVSEQRLSAFCLPVFYFRIFFVARMNEVKSGIGI